MVGGGGGVEREGKEGDEFDALYLLTALVPPNSILQVVFTTIACCVAVCFVYLWNVPWRVHGVHGYLWVCCHRQSIDIHGYVATDSP